ncbi:MAG TPA: HAD family hydrolase [Candidatus Bathyarchaeia archaeon]|nr:HAD family hydrolase [Candidatus Bathyarchaeia archaeon]
MPQRAKAIFFDLGETLVTQNIEDNMVTRNALEDIGKILPREFSVEHMFRLYQKGYSVNNVIRSEYNVEIPIHDWMRRLLERLLGSEPTSPLVSQCVRIVVMKRAANAIAFSDAHATLQSLSKRRIKLGIISNVSSHEVMMGILRRMRLEHFFQIFVSSASTGIRKPDPGIFQYALRQLDLDPSEAAIVGDSERHDIRGGKSAGLQTVLVNRRTPIEDSEADYKFRSLAEAAKTLQSL